MHLDERRRQLERLTARCRERRIPLTLQRRAVLSAVLDLDVHPTAAQLHAAVQRRAPGLSRTTVYRTLETLTREGLLAKDRFQGRVDRYDYRTEPHIHLVCTGCDAVADLASPPPAGIDIAPAARRGFEVREISLQMRGLCRRCRKKEESR